MEYEIDSALQEQFGEFAEPVSETVESISLEDLQAIRDDLVHTELFGSFLVCGCIVALALFRRFK